MSYIIRKILMLLTIFSVSTTLLASEKMYVAIVDFEVTSDLEFENPGKAISRMMINPLKETGKFRLFERVLLRKILDEQILCCRTFAEHSHAWLCTVVKIATGITTNKLNKTTTYI